MVSSVWVARGNVKLRVVEELKGFGKADREKLSRIKGGGEFDGSIPILEINPSQPYQLIRCLRASGVVGNSSDCVPPAI